MEDSIRHNIKVEDLRPKDRENGYPIGVPKWYIWLFQRLPGVFTWSLLLAPFAVAFLGRPEVMVIYIAFLTIYWGYRGILFAYGISIGIKRMDRDIATDWMDEIEKLETKKDKDLKYVYICPIVNEGMDVLGPGIDMFAKQTVGAENISIVFALEEKFQHESIPNCEKLIEKYKDQFGEMYYDVHPMGIPGEASGVKGANINWASRRFVKRVRDRGEKLSKYLLITCDSDLRPHKKYLSSITYKFLTSQQPYKTFYSTAIHTFNNNIWKVPAINRVFAHSLTLAIFHSWVVQKEMRDTWSSYVVNLKTVHKVGYWDPQVGIDDTTFYWNALLRYKGKFYGEEVYVPTYNDAVENENYIKSHKSLYKQQLRWGWGIIVFPITMAGLYKNRDISFFRKIWMILKLVHNQMLFLTVVYSVTFTRPILTLFSPEFQYSSASYNLARATSVILTALMFLNIPVYIVRQRLTPHPDGWSFRRRVYDFFEIILITVNMLTFGFIPKVQAQTEMMFNKFRTKYYATEKVAINK